MDALQAEYHWYELPQKEGQNSRTFSMPIDALAFTDNCPVCLSTGVTSRLPPKRKNNNGNYTQMVCSLLYLISHKLNLYEQCGTRRHIFLWKKPRQPLIELDGYPPAKGAPQNTNVDELKCANPLPTIKKNNICNAKRAQGCAQHRCRSCCVEWAESEFRRGYTPLNLCAIHVVEVEKRIADIVNVPGGIVGILGVGDDANVALPVDPPAAVVAPAQRARPAGPAARPNPRGPLAAPVQRVPTALPADDLANLYMEPAAVRYAKLANMNRLGRERDSDQKDRVIKIFWWRSDVRSYIIVLNT